jgi:hypothetical protein
MRIKNKIEMSIIIPIISLGFIFGCTTEKEQSNVENRVFISYKQDVNLDTTKAAEATSNYLSSGLENLDKSSEKVINILSEYELGNTANQKSLASFNGDKKDFFERIDSLLPYDLSVLQRKKSVYNEGKNLYSIEEITLEKELEELALELQETMKNMSLNIEDALNLENVIAFKNGILVDGELFLDPTNISHITSIEMYNSLGRGESIENFVNDFNHKLENTEEIKNLQGLYESDLKKWPNGVVYYRFDKKIKENIKTSVLGAMKEITGDTDSLIKFKDVAIFSGWKRFLFNIGWYKSVRIYSEKIKVPAAAKVGYVYKADLVINDDDSYTKSQRDYLALHELGHVIGLKHEHQRADRDENIIVSDQLVKERSVDYSKINKTKKSTYIKWTLKTFLSFGKVRYKMWVPGIYTSDVANSYLIGEFDCHSLMLYENIPLKSTPRSFSCQDLRSQLNIGFKTSQTKTSYHLSKDDITTIRKIYD